MTKTDRNYLILHCIVCLAAVVSYFVVKNFLQYTDVETIIVSNLTLNLFVFVVAWGLLEPTIYKRLFHKTTQPLVIWLVSTLGGFFIIILLLTVTGTHTRLTDLFMR